MDGKNGLVCLGLVLLLLIGGSLFAIGVEREKLIGLLLDGYQENCMIIRNDKMIKATQEMELYTGDVIIKKPDVKLLTIHFYPYATGETEGKTRLRMVFNPPRNESGFFDRFLELIGFEMRHYEHKVNYTVSRGDLVDKLKIKKDLFSLVPFNQATIFSSGKIRFQTPSGKEKLITIYDGQIVEIASLQMINNRVNLDEIQSIMKPGRDYYWMFDTSGSYIQIRVLGADDERRIKTILGQIAENGSSDTDIKITQAIFLNAISDAYPERIDLYWMSYEILRELVFSPALVSDEELKKIEFFLEQVYAAKIEFAVN